MEPEPLVERPDSDFECVICLELPTEAVSCSNCRQIMCWQHVRDLKNSCPYCRASPFSLRYEYDLESEVERRKARLKDKNTPLQKKIACKAYRCDYVDTYDNLLIHKEAVHPQLSVDVVMFGIPAGKQAPHDSRDMEPRKERKDPRDLLPKSVHSLLGNDITEHDIENAKSLSQPVSDQPLARGRMKLPTYAEALVMGIHVRTCPHPKCKYVWRGRWGSFIGGPNGGTHFDLTTCVEGRLLNEEIGWNYDDPPN